MERDWVTWALVGTAVLVTTIIMIRRRGRGS